MKIAHIQGVQCDDLMYGSIIQLSQTDQRIHHLPHSIIFIFIILSDH